MALNATLYNFEISLADADRGVYEALALRVARHPSEAGDYLVARTLAYCLEYAEGIAFSRGLSSPDEPAVMVRDLTGAWRAWIEVGAPDAARLHRAAKAAPRVVLYTQKDPAQVMRALSGQRIHRADALELMVLPRAVLDTLVARLDRRMKFELAVSGGHLYLTLGDTSVDGALERLALDAAA